MGSEILLEDLRQNIDFQLRKSVNCDLVNAYPQFRNIFEYQLGWEGQGSSDAAQGKRLRPMIVLLSAYAAGGNWKQALPASAAIELMHNFSLIHDDIQDQSRTRRGRETIWVKWGVAQAINAGDAMLGLANLALLDLLQDYPSQVVVEIEKLFQSTLVELTRGQYLDLAYETVDDLSLEDYNTMINGKTAALLACSMEIGSILGGADESQSRSMAKFGRMVGKAFQIQDDWLGIWGLDQITGKPSTSDLVERKKTFPILLGIRNSRDFQKLWNQTPTIDEQNIQIFADLLIKEGIKEKTEFEFTRVYHEAEQLFKTIDFDEKRKSPLIELVHSILVRMK